MRILHISKSDSGGAAIAAIRLHKALLSQEIESSMLFLSCTNKSLPNSYAFLNGSQIKLGFIMRQGSRIKNKLLYRFSNQSKNVTKLQNKIKGFETFTFNPTDFDITSLKAYKEADIIHLHWISGFIDYGFFQINKKPVIWTLHDMNPFTGGCHYSSGCNKYLTDCKNCPQLQGTSNSDNAFFDQEYKNVCLERQTHIITAPSQWLKNCAIRSKLFKKFQGLHIPNSLDQSIFRPQNKAFCRSVFSLPCDKKILLFVSEKIENSRKGFDLLINALSCLDRKDFHVCAVGDSDPTVKYQNNISFLGGISDERLMSLAYSAADCFVLPSREDNLPNVMLESISCGTPVIAFPVGGMLDVIKTGINGILAKEISSDSLTNAINEFLEGKYSFDSIRISEDAKQNFQQSVQANRYASLYKTMLPSSE